MKYHFEPEHECKQCGNKFHRSSNVNDHMNFHFDTTYSCLLCGKKFHTLSDLKRLKKKSF